MINGVNMADDQLEERVGGNGGVQVVDDPPVLSHWCLKKVSGGLSRD